MTQDERMARIRRMATNIIGFHELLENETVTLSAVDRIMYEAIVNGSGVPLAVALVQLFSDDDRD